MKRFLLMKSLLVAILLGVGQSAWADGTKRVLYSEDFENATTPAEVNWSGHSSAHVAISTNASYTTYGKFVSGWPEGSGNRSMGGTLSFTSSGYSTTEMTDLGYVIEFDALLKGGSQQNKAKSELIIPYVSALKSDGNTYYDESEFASKNAYLFAISQSNTTGSFEKTWYINDLSNSTGTTASLEYNIFYHWKFVVTKTSCTYTISAAGKDDIIGSKTLSALETVPLAKQVYMLLGRSSAWFLFDNIEVYDYTDAEVMTEPTISNPAYAGANRTVTITAGESSKSNSVTTYYTTDGTVPSASNNAGSFTTSSQVVTLTTNCTVKAISISSDAVASLVATSSAITVGKLALAAPTFTKTGATTYTITADQSGLAYVPASTTIKYRVGTTGDFATYSSAVTVAEGSILYAYAEADNYTTSSTTAVANVALPAMTRSWGQDFARVVGATLSFSKDAEGTLTNCVESSVISGYYVPASGSTALTDERIAFETWKNTKSVRQWNLYTDRIYSNGSGNHSVKIAQLLAGQVVKVVGAITSCDGTVLVSLSDYSYDNIHYYYVKSSGTGTLTMARYTNLYSVDVYTLDNETVGALDCTTAYSNVWNTTPIWINAGETAYYKIVNYNNGGNTLFQNWYLFGATEGDENVVIFGPNHSNTATNATYTSKPEFTNADLNGATVELTTTLTDAGGGSYTLTTTAVTTKADGITTLTPNLVYQQTGLTTSKLKLFVSVENSFLELLEQAVVKNITSAGYATYYSNNALDFANATPALTASIVTGASGNSLVMENVDDVPAETGVILAGDEDTYTIPVIASSSTSTSSNKLNGVHSATVKDANSIYVLMASPSVAFYKNTSEFTVGANTAYLNVADLPAPAGARAFYSLFDSETTGVGASLVNSERVNNEIFNLQGQRVSQPTKGLYIVNGKKIIVK